MKTPMMMRHTVNALTARHSWKCSKRRTVSVIFPEHEVVLNPGEYVGGSGCWDCLVLACRVRASTETEIALARSQRRSSAVPLLLRYALLVWQHSSGYAAWTAHSAREERCAVRSLTLCLA